MCVCVCMEVLIILQTIFAAHQVTYEKAVSLRIGQVIRKALVRYDKEMREHLASLYSFIKTNYNKYTKLLGGTVGTGICAAVKRGDKPYMISDDVPLLRFLTGKNIMQKFVVLCIVIIICDCL